MQYPDLSTPQLTISKLKEILKFKDQHISEISIKPAVNVKSLYKQIQEKDAEIELLQTTLIQPELDDFS